MSASHAKLLAVLGIDPSYLYPEHTTLPPAAPLAELDARKPIPANPEPSNVLHRVERTTVRPRAKRRAKTVPAPAPIPDTCDFYADESEVKE